MSSILLAATNVYAAELTYFTHVGASYYRSTVDTNVHTLTAPTGAQAGDLLVAFIYQDDSDVVANNLGVAEGEYGSNALSEWVSLDVSGATRWYSWYRKWDGVTSTWTHSKVGPDTAAGVCVAFRPNPGAKIKSLNLANTVAFDSTSAISANLTSVATAAAPGARLQGFFLTGRATSTLIRDPIPTFTPSTGWTHVDGEPLSTTDHMDYAYKLPTKGDVYVSQAYSTTDEGRQHTNMFVIDAE